MSVHPGPTAKEAMFAPVPAAEEGECDPRARRVSGNGSAFLPVPGLKKLAKVVNSGGMEIPLSERRDHLVSDEAGERIVTSDEAHVELVATPDGPALRRSKLSDGAGRWPASDHFTVTGDWEPEKKK